MRALLAHVEARTGLDVSGFAPGAVTRALGRRMRAVGTADALEYLGRVRSEPQEAALLTHEVILNYTAFFREVPAWEFLRRDMLPGILRRRGRLARLWSAGCASGEEAYTLAILAAEAAGGREPREPAATIIATDIDEEALAEAVRGEYRSEDLRAVPAWLRRRWFEPGPSGFRVRSELRRMVEFMRHDLAADPPVDDVDLVVCRHTLMYFDPARQAAILGRLHRALAEGGVLFVESTDRLVGAEHRFAAVAGEHGIFRKV